MAGLTLRELCHNIIGKCLRLRLQHRWNTDSGMKSDYHAFCTLWNDADVSML
ncbi:hypothetical protein LINGRAHAP2_LOCUS23941 [Linum grandiflorum]